MGVYTFFVSFRTDDGQWGNSMVVLDSKITHSDHINQVQAFLAHDIGKPIMVINFHQVSYEKVKKVTEG